MSRIRIRSQGLWRIAGGCQTGLAAARGGVLSWSEFVTAAPGEAPWRHRNPAAVSAIDQYTGGHVKVDRITRLERRLNHIENVFATQRENINRALDEARLKCLELEAGLRGLRGAFEAVQTGLEAQQEVFGQFTAEAVEALRDHEQRIARLESEAS